MMEKQYSKSGLMLRGMAMGIAEVIPGVSGGTIAFITGIYETLIDSIKAIGPDALQSLKADGVKGLWSALNGHFLLWLLAGMVLGLGIGIVGVSYLMEHFPEPLWAFFFGLILASAVYIAAKIEEWTLASALLLVLGAVGAFFLTTLSPAEGSLHPLYVYCSGAIAISALMLPGISGSFILLIMGMYTVIIPLIKDTVKNFDTAGLVTLSIFGLGCLTGLVVFSRVLSWLFKTYKEPTFALLTGFLLGALNKVWPWRNITTVLDKDSGRIIDITSASAMASLDKEQVKVLSESNVLPDSYWANSPMTWYCVITFILGICLVYFLAKYEKNEP